MIDGMLVEDEFFSKLIADQIQKYVTVAGRQQGVQVTNVPGLPPLISPEWAMQQLFSLRIDLLRVNLELIVTRFILEGVSKTDSANKEDSDIQEIFQLVEKKVGEHMERLIKATEAKTPSPIVIPGNNGVPPGLKRGGK